LIVVYLLDFDSILTLILLPVFLSAWNDLRRNIYYLWSGGIKPTAEEIEPAVKEMISENYETNS